MMCDFCDKYIIGNEFSILQLMENFVVVDNWIVCEDCLNKIKHLMKINQNHAVIE